MTQRQGAGEDDRSLAVELTALSLARVAPDELVVLDETAAEYFADPDAVLRESAGDRPLGSGIAVVMLTPYVLAVSQVVLPLLGSIVTEMLKGVVVDVAKEPLTVWIRRLFRANPGVANLPQGAPVALSAAQATQVRQAVVDQCYRLGLPSEQAALLADATIGSLNVRR